VTAGRKESDGSSGKVAICEVAMVACWTVDNLGADCRTVRQSDSRQLTVIKSVPRLSTV
jgi:hypothetical protein